MTESVIVSIVGAISTLTIALIAYKKDIKIKKLEKEHKQTVKVVENRSAVLESILKLEVFNKLYAAVTDIFENTAADRFLILFATNGKVDTDTVSVIFEQHKTNKGRVHVNAMAQYHQIKVDDDYLKILKRSEFEDIILLNAEELGNSVLGKIYRSEGVCWSLFKFISRNSIDPDNDVLTYSSCATYSKNLSEKDQVYISSKYGYIKSLILDISDVEK